MGWNSTIVVLHDALAQIAEDKDFGRKLSDAILNCSSNGHATKSDRTVNASSLRGGIGNAAYVVESHHADGSAIVAVGGNLGKQIGFAIRRDHQDDGKDKLLILEQLAEQLGYSIRKKPQRKMKA